MVEYKILDNFLRPDILEGIRQSILSPKNPWGLKSGLSKEADNAAVSFGLNLYNKGIVLNYAYYSIVGPLIEKLAFKKIHRAIVNLVPLPRKPITAGIHTDHTFSHNVLIFYVNTNNGYTVLDPDRENIKIDCLENRVLIFNGLIPHTGILQSDEDLRINVNITFE